MVGNRATTRSEDPLLRFRRRHLRDEVELVIGRSAVRVILALLTFALGAALALTGSGNGRDIVEIIRRLPSF
jgi:hypothetical protein